MISLYRQGIVSSSRREAGPFIGEDLLQGRSGIWVAQEGYIFEDVARTIPAMDDMDVIQGMNSIASASTITPEIATQIVNPVNSPSWNETNKTLVTDGLNDILYTEISPNNTHMTIGVRFRKDPSPNGTKVIMGSAISSSRTWISTTNGVLSAGVGQTSSNAFQDTTALDLSSATEFHTGFVTWENSGDVVLYRDGVEVNRVPKSGLTSVYNFTIGGRRTSAAGAVDLFFGGEISHALISSNVFTPAQVAQVHNGWNS